MTVRVQGYQVRRGPFHGEVLKMHRGPFEVELTIRTDDGRKITVPLSQVVIEDRELES